MNMNGLTIKLTAFIVCSAQLLTQTRLTASPSSIFPHPPDDGEPGSAQFWQQEVHYDIDVTLNDRDRSLLGSETIRYINRSPDTLNFIWFHCWPNAYKDNSTALYRQLSQLEERRSKLKKMRENGYIDQLAFTVNGSNATTQTHPLYNDVIKLLLPTPLLPGGQITIRTPFFVKIPSYFSRLGHEG